LNLQRAVQPQKAHKTHKKANSTLKNSFTKQVIIFLALRFCFFSVNFVPYVANRRY